MVKPGQIVQVRVMRVDAERNRVNLSMRAEGAAPVKAQRPPRREQITNSVLSVNHKVNVHNRVKIKLNVRSVVSKKTTRAKIGGFGALLLQAGIRVLNKSL